MVEISRIYLHPFHLKTTLGRYSLGILGNLIVLERSNYSITESMIYKPPLRTSVTTLDMNLVPIWGYAKICLKVLGNSLIKA